MQTRSTKLPPLARVVLGLMVLVVTGTVLLMLPWMSTGGGLRWNQALFTASSALSVTGLSIIVPSQELTLLGQITLLILIQTGGVGFMVGAVVIFEMIGRRISLRNRLALTDSLGLLSPANIVLLTRRVLIGVLGIEAAGALILFLNWRGQLGDDGQAAFYALFHAVSAFCNAGFDLFTGLPSHPTGIPTDTVTLLTLGALIILGGLGIPVLADFIGYQGRERLSLHTRLTLWTIAILNVVGTIGFFLEEWFGSGVLRDEGLGRGLLISGFQVVAARTAGFSGLEAFAELLPSTQLLLIAWMFIGCAPASMGGGITTGTATTLVVAFWSYVKGRAAPEIMGRSLSVDSVRRAAAVLTISLTVVLVSTWLLLLTHAVSFQSALFEVVSAFATTGLSLGFTTELNLFGQLLISFVMLWGRLGALTIIVALARPVATPLVQYPEEQVLIG